jgi:hypothetical protein
MRRTVSRRLADALEHHRRWLRRRGVRPPGRRDRERWAEEYAETLRTGLLPERFRQEPLAGGADACADRSLMARLHREPEHVRKEVMRKASMVAPAFNKGALQYAPDNLEGEDRESSARYPR